MYIAFKWLFCMGVLMWGFMCGFHEYLQRNQIEDNISKFGYILENLTDSQKADLNHSLNHKVNPYLTQFNYVLLVTCTLVVLFYNKRKELLTRAINERFFQKTIISLYKKNSKDNIMELARHSVSFSSIRKVCSCVKNAFDLTGKLTVKHEMSDENLNKLKRLDNEKRKLDEMLVIVTDDNINIKNQLQLEKFAKERLFKHVQEMNKQIKDDKNKFLNFQNLYKATYQENIFLKCKIKKLVKDKNLSEQNLMNLVQKVYQSKNSELLEYCSRFIVQTKDNLLKTDVRAEIKDFLRKSHKLKDRNGFVITELDFKTCPVSKLVEIKEDSGSCEIFTGSIVEALNNYESNCYCKNRLTKTIRSSSRDFEFNKPALNNSHYQLAPIQSKQNFVTQSQEFKNFLMGKVNVNPPYKL